MFIPPVPARPVRLYAADGSVTEFSTLREFVAAHGLYWIKYSLGPGFRVCACARPCERPVLCPNTQCFPFVLRDVKGEVISIDDCEREWRTQRRAFVLLPRHGRYRFWNGEGPVPYTGKHGTGHWYRRIRTYPEHRVAVGVCPEEGEPEFRAARNPHNLPSAWDDRRVAARDDRSWKRYRDRQFKPRV